MHLGLHFFDIDVFELFEKPVTEPNTSKDRAAEITDTISELEKSIQELKDVSNI